MNYQPHTLLIHNFTEKHYLLDKQKFREVFFEGLEDIFIQSVMSPRAASATA